VPPGNPTVEAEAIALAAAIGLERISLHFTRMVAHGEAGAHHGFEERMRSQIAHVSECTGLLAMVKPRVIVMAHAGMSALLGPEGEADLVARMEREHSLRFVTAFGAVLGALAQLGAKRVALGTPYDAESTARTRRHLEANGINVVAEGRLEDVRNIYDLSADDARALARKVDVPAAQAVFLSGLGMPTVARLAAMEDDLGKPVVSGAVASMWYALTLAGERPNLKGYGRLLAG